jgi:hypothetical protein
VWDNSLGNNRYAQIENWDIAFQPSRFDTAIVRSGTAVVDAVGQHAGTLRIAPENGDTAQLNITAGRLEVQDEVEIGVGPTELATLHLSGGELSTPLLSKGARGSFLFTGGTLRADVVDFNLANLGGTLAPGRSIGMTQITCDLLMYDGVLEIEIGGTGIGQFDRLEVDGVTLLGGTLRVELVELDSGPYVPQLGDTFGFLAAFGGAGGMFEAFDLPPLAAGLEWALAPGDVMVFLSVIAATLPGDFNSDGIVDAGDYVVWRKGLGTTYTQADYDVWLANFGASSGSGSVSNSIAPEPTSGWLLLWAAVVGACCRRLLRDTHQAA